jgi:predicted  nucleic acid-binding Zn-ribbon protein
LQAEKDEELLDLKDKLGKEKERILQLEKDIVDLQEELTLAQGREA